MREWSLAYEAAAKARQDMWRCVEVLAFIALVKELVALNALCVSRQRC